MKDLFNVERGNRSWFYQIDNSGRYVQKSILKSGEYIIEVFGEEDGYIRATKFIEFEI